MKIKGCIEQTPNMRYMQVYNWKQTYEKIFFMDRCTGQLVDAEIHLNLSIGVEFAAIEIFRSIALKVGTEWKEQCIFIHYISGIKLGSSRLICFVLVLEFMLPNTLFGWLLCSMSLHRCTIVGLFDDIFASLHL